MPNLGQKLQVARFHLETANSVADIPAQRTEPNTYRPFTEKDTEETAGSWAGYGKFFGSLFGQSLPHFITVLRTSWNMFKHPITITTRIVSALLC